MAGWFRVALKFFVVLLLFIVLGKVLFLALNPTLGPALLNQAGWASLVWGLRLDLAATAALALLALLCYGAEALLFKRTLLTRIVLCGALAWSVATTLIDGMYMADVGRHITFEVFTGSGLEGGLLMTALSQYPWHVLAGVALILAGVYVVIRMRIDPPVPVRGASAWGGVAVFWVVWLGLSVTLIRGGWSDVPQSPMTAYRIGDPEQAKVAWNAPYAMTYYLGKGQKKAAHQVTAPPSQADMAIVRQMVDVKAPQLETLKSAGVILVLLESWTAADLYSYAQRVDAAPFFDDLRGRSLTTSRMYADGHRTVEGMFSVLCSFPNPVGGGVAGTQLQGLPYRCLPQLLREQGWSTKFIQGSGRGIVGAFAQTLGFEYSYGKTDFDFEGQFNHWGYMDDDIYRFALKEISAMQAPFFVSINTNTTHDTFLPAESDYVFGKGHPDHVRQAVTRHADRALQGFIEKLTAQLTTPALIVLVADHTKTANAPGLEGNAIPFLAFATDGSLPAQHLDVSASQRDIAPTIMDWLGGYVPWFSGDSLLSTPYLGKASFSQGRQVTWVEGRHVTRFDAGDPEVKAACSILDAQGLIEGEGVCNFAASARGAAYTRYTQDLLFRGCTQAYGRIGDPPQSRGARSGEVQCPESFPTESARRSDWGDSLVAWAIPEPTLTLPERAGFDQ